MSDDSPPAATRDAALDALPDPVFVFDDDGSVQYANGAASDATGRDRDALRGTALTDLFDGVTAARLRAAARADADGAPLETLLVTDDTPVPVAVQAAPVADDSANGRLVVTARTLPDDQQRTPEYRGILDRMTDAFFAVDEDWRFTYVNESAREIVGEAMAEDPGDDLEGRSLWEAVPDAVDTRFYEEYHEAMETQESVAFEEYYEPLDVHLAVRAYPSPSGLSVYFRDVTERHRREQALADHERVLREMQAVTADTDLSFDEQVDALLDIGIETLDVSSGALSNIRGDDYEFQAVRGLSGTEPGDVVPVSATNCELTASERQTLVMANIARDAPELTEKTGYAEWGISCYLGAPVFVEGDVYGTFCFYDETPRTEPFTEWEVTLVDLMSQWVGYELTRRRVRERLESQNEKLDQFASIVSHDLRNPLNVLDGYLDLAEQTGDREHFEQCRQTVDRMETLVDDLLTLARAGEGVDELAPTSLDATARQAWSAVDAPAATLTVESDERILADDSRLQQLLGNLFRNAVEHGSTGNRTAGGSGDAVEHGSTSPDSQARQDADERGGDGVEVTVGTLEDGFFVADDGPGIPPSDREAVMDAGYSTRDDGTGFGLNIVAEIADAHDWSVSITDAESGGASFEVHRVETA